MNVRLQKSKAKGTIYAPPSKSYAHRLLIASMLAQGKGQVDGITDSLDMKATLNCISALGVEYEKKENTVFINGGPRRHQKPILNCHESGSTLRFFIPIALVFSTECRFLGTERLMSRGLDVYFDIFKEQGIEYTLNKDSLEIKGQLKPSTFKVRGDISSQFITGLLFALPLLNGDSKIEITTPLESKAYVDITLEVLKTYGIEIERQQSTFLIKGNQKYKSLCVSAEGDASNSAFLDAFNVIGGDVSVLGLNESTIQGDYVYKKLFEQLKNTTPTIDLSDCPDLGPITFALASSCNGATITGIRRLRIKESDRVEAMATELRKLGCEIDTLENSVVIKGGIREPSEILKGHNDHRIVMALSVLCTIVGGEIEGCEAVNKSYPHFFEDLETLGIFLERKI
ncbi:MAG: 3-phosphoshikimate 1-carboxyvinyltransferase [Clostridia bacterium]|nr:3-phosphoshikimate 1-carboxyvinyltransferase [Clostridia bacterium]